MSVCVCKKNYLKKKVNKIEKKKREERQQKRWKGPDWRQLIGALRLVGTHSRTGFHRPKTRVSLAKPSKSSENKNWNSRKALLYRRLLYSKQASTADTSDGAPPSMKRSVSLVAAQWSEISRRYVWIQDSPAGESLGDRCGDASVARRTGGGRRSNAARLTFR